MDCEYSPRTNQHVLCFVFKVGNNIQADITKLHKDFCDLDGSVGPVSELISLTEQPSMKRTLASLVRMVSDKELDKDLGGGALIDWTDPFVSVDSLQYAANDAWASLFVWLKLSGGLEGALQSGGASVGLGPGTRGQDLSSSAGRIGAELAWNADLDDACQHREEERAPPDLPECVGAEVEVGVSTAAWMDFAEEDEVVELAADENNIHSTPPEVCLYSADFFLHSS